jgi:hypothetical protein
MQTWVRGGIAPPFSTSALDGGEWSASRPGRFTPRGKAPSTHRLGGWVGPRTGLDNYIEEKTLSLLGHTTSIYRQNCPDS